MTIFRTISQFINTCLLPEIDKRIANGKINRNNLPIGIYQFRVIQKKLANGGILNIIEINEEVEIIAKVKGKRKIKAGEIVTIDDIYTDECFIETPMINGKHCAYILFKALFLGYTAFFNFMPNSPDFKEENYQEPKNPYPIIEFINFKNFKKITDPFGKMRILSDKNWPPSPSYYPKVLLDIHNDPNLLNDPNLVEDILKSCNKDYWDNYIENWKNFNIFKNRIQYLEKSISAFFNSDYITAIYVLVPQFEGIIRDYLKECGINTGGGFKDYVDSLKSLIFSRKILLFPKDIFEIIFNYLETGSFWDNTSNIIDPNIQINRHGLLHGIFTGVETKEITLKFLLLLDSLSFIIFHDKILNNSV